MRRLSNWIAKRAGNYITVYAVGDEGEDVRVTKVTEMSPGKTPEGVPCVMALYHSSETGRVESLVLLTDSQPSNDQVDDSPEQAERD